MNGATKPRIFNCSARGIGHHHERRRFRRDKPTEATQERKRGGRYGPAQNNERREGQRDAGRKGKDDSAETENHDSEEHAPAHAPL